MAKAVRAKVVRREIESYCGTLSRHVEQTVRTDIGIRVSTDSAWDFLGVAKRDHSAG